MIIYFFSIVGTIVFLSATVTIYFLYSQNRKHIFQNKNLSKDLEFLKAKITEKEIELKNTLEKSTEFSDKLFLSYSQLTDLDSLLRELNSYTDLKLILDALAKYFHEKFLVPHYLLYVYSAKEEKLLFYHSNFPSDLDESKRTELMTRKIPVNNEYVTTYAHAYAWKRKRSFFIQDLDKYNTKGVELENKITANLRSLLIVPLFLRKKYIGSLDLLDYSGNLNLNEHQLNQIKIIGDYVAGSIESGFLLDELKKTNDEIQIERDNIVQNQIKLESLHKFNRRINSYSQLEDITREVFLYLKQIFNVELGFILLTDTKQNQLIPFQTSTDIFNKGLLVSNFLKNFRVPIHPSSGTLYRTFTKQKPLYLHKSSAWTNLSKIDMEIVSSFKLDSFAQIPLVVQGSTIGIICVTRLTSEMDWTKEEFKEISSFGEQVAGAIHNANLRRDLEFEREKTRRFIKNILPGDLAEELIEKGEVVPMEYESVTILFTDFKNFTKSAESLSPEDLIEQLDGCFSQFDDIALRHKFEKLKTIGDAYMAAGGIPQGNFTHPVDACLFAMEIKSFMNQIRNVKQMLGQDFWEIRLGIHTGPVVAGIVGKTKFAYDVWGDTVNTASRMESSGEPGEINLSDVTYDKVKRFFECEYRGKIKSKNKDEMGMYFLKRLKPEFSRDKDGLVPNQFFLDLYKNLEIGAKIIYRQTG